MNYPVWWPRWMRIRLHLIEDTREVLKRAWSVRFHGLAALCALGETVAPWFNDVIPRGPLAVAMLVFCLLGLYARFVKQEKLHDGD